VNTLNVFFLFPGYVCFGFLGHWTPNRQKIYRAKFFVFFGAVRIDTEFQRLVSILFLRILLPRNRQHPANRGVFWARIAVCFDKAVPVASEAWHVLVSVKVLVR
jgi:hypothetical protein